MHHLVVYLVCATQGGQKLHWQDKIQAKNKTEKLKKQTDYNKKLKPKMIYNIYIYSMYERFECATSLGLCSMTSDIIMLQHAQKYIYIH